MKIDIFQDTVCPWCRIGEQNLFHALKSWDAEPVEIHWRAFLLDSTTPLSGRPYSELTKKFGGEDSLRQMHDRVCEAGEACGLEFKFDKLSRMPNTVRSHQLIQITPPALQTEMADAVTAAYFEQGRDIGDLEVLLEIATALGLDKAETRQKMESGQGQSAVQLDLAFARDAGITGVPCFIFNDRYGVTGAQPPEVFTQVLDQVHAKQSDL